MGLYSQAIGGNVPAIVNPRQEAFQLRVQSYHSSSQPNVNAVGAQNTVSGYSESKSTNSTNLYF